MMRVVGGVKKRNWKINMTLNNCGIFSNAQSAYRMVKSFFHMYSIGKHDKQNILNLESMLCHLKPKVSTNRLSIAGFFEKNQFAHKY